MRGRLAPMENQLMTVAFHLWQGIIFISASRMDSLIRDYIGHRLLQKICNDNRQMLNTGTHIWIHSMLDLFTVHTITKWIQHLYCVQ